MGVPHSHYFRMAWETRLMPVLQTLAYPHPRRVCYLYPPPQNTNSDTMVGRVGSQRLLTFAFLEPRCMYTPLLHTKVRDALIQEFPSYDIVEFMGTGPILAQLKTFATASLILAPHGAGLSNMMVSPLHTPVLEIGPLECSSCYIHLAVKVTSDPTGPSFAN